MSANFDWQTEEDERRSQQNIWDEATEPDEGRMPRRRPPWRLIAVIAVLVAMVGGLIWWRVDQRIEATLEAFRTDVIASHNLVQRAVAEGDGEIFRSVLSGRVPTWTAAEMEVFKQEMIFDRTPLGLAPMEGSLPIILPATGEETPADGRPAQIEFSADLSEAVVVVDHPFLVDNTGETILLQQTTIYRRGDSRWLLAPPLDEFWGDWTTTEGDYLSLIYPRRDEAIAARLAGDLDAEIGRMCATLQDINCSADLYLTVRLDTDPAALAALAKPLGALRRAREQEDILELPAPTLVGLPVEGDAQMQAAGYDALRDGYARHILGAAIVQAVNWDCCDNALLFNILLEYQLGELEIADWPIDTADHQRVLASRTRLSDLSNYLRARFPTEIGEDRLWELRAAVDFLANGVPGISAADMQRTLNLSRSFAQFLDAIVYEARAENSALIPNNLDLAWWLYALSDEAEASNQPGEPAEDLYLSCAAVEGNQSTDTSTLLRYLPEEDSWSEIYSLPGFIWMSALPDPRTLLMQEFAYLEIETWRTNVWRDGRLVPAYVPDDGRYAISFGETDPTGQKLVAYSFDPEVGVVRGFILDLTACEDGCATTDSPGRPFWSPNGERAIYMGDNETFPEDALVTANNRYIIFQGPEGPRDYPLTLGAGDATPGSPLTAIGDGRAPFWLDNQTYGFIRRADSGGPIALSEDEIVLAAPGESSPLMIIPASDLYEFLPEVVSTRRLSLGYVATHPQQPNRLFIVVLDSAEFRSYVIVYDLNTRLPEVRLQLLYNLNHSLSFSPDGRYLVMTGQDRNTVSPGDNSAMLLLHDIEANRTIPLLSRLPFFLPSVVFDWTEDSRWLAVALEDDLVGLIAPDEQYTRLLPHSSGACTSVAWLQK